MSKLGWVLLLGGAAIAAIVYWGTTTVSKKSDVEILQEAIFEQQEIERQKQEDAAALSKKVLAAPESCAGLVTAVVYEICETEPNPGGDWPDWKNLAGEDEQACLVEAFHQTNEHAFAIRSEAYDRASLTLNRMGLFVSDLCRASLFTDGVNYGDTDASLETLIAGFYADRAGSTFGPQKSY